jgi:hypothetical protein
MKTRSHTRLLVWLVTLSSPWTLLAFAKSKGGSIVQVIISDEGKPADGGKVSLDRLKSEDCAQLFLREGTRSKDEIEQARTCVSDTHSAGIHKDGSVSLKGLEAGWYMVRLTWPMTNPPDTKEPLGCENEGWIVSYVPWKESGKNKGFAQGPPFEVKSGETKKIEFDYKGPFKVTAGCPKPIKWMRKP